MAKIAASAQVWGYQTVVLETAHKNKKPGGEMAFRLCILAVLALTRAGSPALAGTVESGFGGGSPEGATLMSGVHHPNNDNTILVFARPKN
jgi:hypothetical protein